MSKRIFIPALVALAVATGMAVAGPAPKGAPSGYETKFKQVIEAEKNEEYEKALAFLDEIPAEKHNVYTRLKRAGLLVRLGRFIEAEEILSGLMKDPKADVIRATVQGDLDDVRARMPKLTVRLAAGGGSDVWVTIDGKPIGPPVTIPVNPGTHVVIGTRAGKEVFKQKITLQDSQTLDVEIDATPPAPPVANVSVPQTKMAAHDDVRASSSGAARAVPVFIAGGVFAGIAVGSFFAMSAAQSAGEDACAREHTLTCDREVANASRIRTWESIGWFSAGAAVVSLGIGVVLLSSGTATEKKTALVTPFAGPSGGGLTFSGAF